MKKYISRLHYLTQDLANRTHTQQVISACQAGANWIQYRCLSKGDDALLKEISEIASVCDDWGATLIITDHYHLLDQADVQGVHIENMKADFNYIRQYIGADKTLGGSANTFEDIERGYRGGAVDYFGCGPYSVTFTKPNYYSTLGLEGYREVTERMKNGGIDIPVLAVGGVKLADVDALLGSGVYGIAVSAAVNMADDPEQAFRELYKKLY